MNSLPLCQAAVEPHQPGGGNCWWVEPDGENWAVYVVDGVAYTFAGTFVQFIDELEAP